MITIHIFMKYGPIVVHQSGRDFGSLEELWYFPVVCILHATVHTLEGQLQFVLEVKRKIV